MYRIKKLEVFASEIADFLGAKLCGSDFIVRHPASSRNFQDESFIFLEGKEKLASEKLKKHNTPSTILDVEHAIDEMISDMTLLGADKNNIEVCLVTGENIPVKKKNPLYARCIKSAVELLEKKHIRCKECLPSESCKAHVALDVESGNITYA